MPRTANHIESAESHKHRADHFMARRGLARQGLPQGAAARLLIGAREAHAAMALSASASLLTQPWQAIGPAQVSGTAYGSVTGRVTSIAADPSDATGNTVYIGTTGGGVWKSSNAAAAPGAASFLPLTDDLPPFSQGSLASLSIGAVSVQPGGTGVILAGTGDPNDALDSYYGSGILRSADGGVTWSLIQNSSDETINLLANFSFIGNAFAGFAWSGQNPNLVVAAVSQSAEGFSVGAEEFVTAAETPLSIMGLYYSTDAGQTWLLATISDGPNQIVQTTTVPLAGTGNAATAIVWNPLRQRFLAAVRFHGYYESADGITFTRLANQPGAGLTTQECPNQPNSVGSPACPILRGALAVQPLSGDTFALTVDINLLDQGLWRDECSAVSGACSAATVLFNQQLPAAPLEDGQGAIAGGDYDLWLAAVPSASDTLLFAGTADIFRCSLAAGCVFRNTTNTGTCAAALVAPFQHAVDSTFAAGLSLLYFGNDSGLWRSTDDVNQTQPPCTSDDADHFQNLNSGLGSLAEVNAIAQDPTSSAVVLAGVGENGTAAATSAGQSVWPQILDGYGSYAAIDPANPQNWYAQSSFGVAISLCANGTACNPAGFGTPLVGYVQVGDDAYASPEPSPFLLDPQSSQNLLVGTCHLWRGPADGLSWSDANILGDLYPGEGTDCAGNAIIQSLAATGTVSGATAVMGVGVELLYAGITGYVLDGPQAYAGHLFEAAVNGTGVLPGGWSDLWLSPVSNDLRGFNPYIFSVSSVIVDPHDPTGQTIYATIAAFSSAIFSTATVYASTNAGATWINISRNLPDAPVNSIAVDPNDANTVYVALDTGVYITTAVTTCPTQNCWSVYGTGLPNSPVTQLATFNAAGQSLLRAATYGRGVWQIPLITAAATTTTATVSPTSLTFASQPVQTASPAQTVTIANSGTIPMTVKQVVVTGDFAVESNCASAVPVGASCTAQVTFTPTATGPRPAVLTIYANVAGGQLTVPVTGSGIPGAAIVLLPTSLNFGTSLIGVVTTPAQNVTISNTGGVAVDLQVPTATGDFAIVANTCSATLAPNFGCTVSLTFTPTASGQRAGIFSLIDSLGTQSAALKGIGVSPATDTVSPNALSFAAQLVGTSSPGQAVTLTNSGDSPLNLITTQITGDFHAVNACGNSLAGHSACAITVTYAPTQVGPENGVLTINDIFGRPQTVTLTGSGLPPSGISVLPSTIDFGDYAVSGVSPTQSVVVTANGSAALKDFAYTISGPFSVASNSCASTVAAGSNCSLQVAFSPLQPGPTSGSLAITGSLLKSVIALSGSGLAFTFLVEGNASATITAGQTANYLLQIAPAAGSSGTLALTCANAPPSSTCTVNPASVQLVSGMTSTVAVAIATVADSGASFSRKPARGLPLYLSLLLLPTMLLAVRLPKSRKSLLLMICLSMLAAPVGCGVSASVGKSASPPGGMGSTPAATYTPVITATGPGIAKTVQLTVVVD